MVNKNAPGSSPTQKPAQRTEPAPALPAAELERIRKLVVADCKERGLSGADAEDVAQKAVLATTQRRPPPDCPKAHALGAGRKLILRLYREDKNRKKHHRCSWGETIVILPNDPPQVTLEEVERWVMAGAAAEQAIVWGQFEVGGRTKAVHDTLADVDIVAIRYTLAYYLAVIAAIPRTRRQQNRLVERLEAEIKNAFAGSGYVVRSQRHTLPRYMLEEFSPSPDQAAHADAGPSSKRARPSSRKKPRKVDGGYVGTLRLIPPLLSRGSMLVRLMCPSIGYDEALLIAEEAMAATMMESDLDPRSRTGARRQ